MDLPHIDRSARLEHQVDFLTGTGLKEAKDAVDAMAGRVRR